MTVQAAPDSVRRNRIFLIGALVVAAVAFGIIAAGGIGKNLVYYWGPTELVAAGSKAIGATIRLGGQVRPGTVKFEQNGSSLDFEVTDLKTSVPVHATGVPPQMFREGIGVVVEGTMTPEGVFRSNRLMVSHGNEYQAPKEGEPVDTKKLIESAEAAADGAKP